MAVCKNLKSMNKNEFEAFINSFDVVLSDCDGVLWRENEVIPRSPETVRKFRELGKKFFYITNNNCKTRSDLVNKCKSLKYAATEEDVLCASYLAAIYLKKQNFKKKAYVVGGEAIVRELAAQGIRSVGVGPDLIQGDELDTLLSFKPDPEVGAVIVGFDKDFSYPKLLKAATYAHDPKVLFICTNPDYVRPSVNSNQFPETGCFQLAIEASAERKALVLGKPEPFVSELIKSTYGVNPARTLMIGDSLQTDMKLGKRAGFTTLLVMSGITSEKDLKESSSSSSSSGSGGSTLPDYCAAQMSDVLDCLEAHS